MLLKKKTVLVVLLSWLFFTSGFAMENKFYSDISDIPEEIVVKMRQFTWQENCPVALKDLSYLSVSYLGYDDAVHIGNMIVNKKLAEEVVEIFKEIFLNKFPIASMKIMSDYQGDDIVSMNNNNSSAFNCREITGKKGVFSNHSYGIAIDINPIENPYVKGNVILPELGKKFTNRNIKKKGMIIKGDKIYQSFIKRGWIWGGNWNSLKDYQHFEKPLHGE